MKGRPALDEIRWDLAMRYRLIETIALWETKRVNDFVSEQVRGKFDDRFVIRPRAYFTSLDEVRNYSWTLPIDIWAAGMKTVMTTYVVARRIEDYAGE